MTPATEKAAPIPAEVLALARETVAQVHEAEGNHHAAFRVREGYMDDRAPMLVALRLLADQVSQEERIREDERARGFNHGYLIATANVINLHRDGVIAADLLLQIDLTIDDAEALNLAEYDMDALKRLRIEPRIAAFFKRKRRARLRGDAS